MNRRSGSTRVVCSTLFVYLFVCMCVNEGERWRERKKKKSGIFRSVDCISSLMSREVIYGIFISFYSILHGQGRILYLRNERDNIDIPYIGLTNHR